MTSHFIQKLGIFLFWFQVFCALFSGSAQALKMLDSTQGLTLSFFIFQIGFMLINLGLSYDALTSANTNRQMKFQSIIVYLMWTIFSILHISIVLWKMPDLWRNIDTVSTSIVLLGLLLIFIYMKIKKFPVSAPYIRMSIAILLKSLPQLFLAGSIFLYGGSGVSGWWLLFGHFIIISRIGHLWISNNQGWNINTRASLISEIWNEITWATATIVWLVV